MKKIAYLLVLITLFIACKKETVTDQTSALLAKNWKMTALDVITPLQGTPLAGQSSNWYAPGCYSDMIWTYNSDGSLTITEAPSCILAGTSGIYNSKWALVNNNREISISGSPFGNFTYTIISLTETKLVVQRNENISYAGGGTINLLLQREYTAQ
jgi:hypothetical protein